MTPKATELNEIPTDLAEYVAYHLFRVGLAVQAP
jgi:hypothetical protein